MPLDKRKIVEAIKKAKQSSKKRNFVQSIELAVNLKDIDLKKPENRLNTEITLPNETGKEPKICVIATGDLAVKAKDAGVHVIDKDELNEISRNRKNVKKLAQEYDFFVARADLMPQVGKTLGPVLGPRGKMPKPIPPNADINAILNQYKKNARIRMRNNPVVHLRVGNENMDEDKVAENVQNVINFLEGKFERGARHIKSVYLKTTMGPAIKVE
ncbi:MAG: 50S ribosomal protein L1 [Candidatus Freyarchaeota archaeon]|nr:50S ribosomal protein L1 [Candidatus Sigynarchaeota archaeon]HDO80866.1 50S ribosomal protein L1 [Candidatus Bathyarchaeota archaeon]